MTRPRPRGTVEIETAPKMSPPNDGPSWIPPLSAFPQFVATISREGRILYVNKKGGPFGEGTEIGTNLEASASKAVWSLLSRAVVRAFERREASIVELFVEPEARWYECNVAPVTPAAAGGEIEAVVLIAQDVTRRREADAALRRSEERYRTLLDVIPDMFFRIDANGVFLDYHGGADTYVPPAEFLGKRLQDVLPAPLGNDLLRAVQRALETRQTTTLDYALPSGVDGKMRHFEARMFYDPGGECLAVVRDVTQRKWAMSALKSSEESFRIIIEQMPDCVMMHRAGTILYANPAWTTLLGYDAPGELVGHDIFEFIHPEDHPYVVDRIATIAETGRSAPPTELRLVRKDGQIARVEIAPVHVVQVADGLANLVVARDLTQRRKMQERFLLADRVASMGALAAGVAHEINNPLTYVIGNLTVAAKGLAGLSPSDAEIPVVRDLEKAIADARAGAERVRYIVGDLRAFSRPDRGELKNLDLRKVLDAAINMAWSEIRHRARLLREYQDTPTVRGSETRLGQVFLNLLINAAQAIEEGGANQNTIRVFTGTDDEGRAKVEICDTGIGFSDEVQSRMWDPFYTTKAGEGTGLGLSICQSIVTSIGGEITASRDPQFGTVFRVCLPPVDALPDVTIRPALNREEGAPIRGRVLVVDDEPVVATLVRRALEGHDVYIMTSGRDALELCRELEFDVIVCDLLMPDLTGMDLFEELRNIERGLEDRVVFMTAGAFTPRARRFLGQVTNPVVEKPFDLDDLATTVQSVLQQHQP